MSGSALYSDFTRAAEVLGVIQRGEVAASAVFVVRDELVLLFLLHHESPRLLLWICIHGCTEVRRVKRSSTQNSMLPSLFLVGVAGSWAPPATVDVSKPPHERWAGAVRTVLDHHGNKLATGFEPGVHGAAPSLFDNLNASTWARLGTAVQTHYPEQAAELGTIANELTAAGLPTTFEYLAGWAYFHALAHTELSSDPQPARVHGVVAQHPTTGAVVHGANMDQTPPEVRNLTLRVSFVNGSDHLFEGVDWYWFTTGVSRAVRRGLASVQENWRFGSVRAADVLADVDAGVVPQIWVFRRAFERLAAAPAATFDDFAAEMATVRLAAPYYAIAAGAQSGEGVVITRNTTGAVATRPPRRRRRRRARADQLRRARPEGNLRPAPRRRSRRRRRWTPPRWRRRSASSRFSRRFRCSTRRRRTRRSCRREPARSTPTSACRCVQRRGASCRCRAASRRGTGARSAVIAHIVGNRLSALTSSAAAPGS